MFYTKVARVIAAIALFTGISATLMGIGLAMSVSAGTAAGEVGRFSGQLIDNGIYSTLIAVAIGVLSDISRSLYRVESGGKGG